MLTNKNDKTIVLIIVKDASGCSHVRLRWNALYYNGFDQIGIIPIITPYPNYDAGWLQHTKAIIFQRPIYDIDIKTLRKYKAYQKKFGYKMIFECDDQCFRINGNGIPEYNQASDSFNPDIEKYENNIKEVLSLIDEVVVSTDYLAKQFQNNFNFQNVRVIRNVVPRFLWSYPRRDDITEDLIKPKVLYTGSPCHYRNPVDAKDPTPENPKGTPGINANMGDFDNAWKDWIIKMVEEDKIEFTIMGAVPYFFVPIINKIKSIPWFDTSTYPRKVMELYADFQIAPLVENEFNKCKSSLRFVESSATGTILLGTVFHTCKDSPYEEIHQDCKIPDNITTKELDEKFWALCKKDKYNEIRNWQYDTINKNGYWMESTKHANEWMSMIDGTPDEKFI